MHTAESLNFTSNSDSMEPIPSMWYGGSHNLMPSPCNRLLTWMRTFSIDKFDDIFDLFRTIGRWAMDLHNVVQLKMWLCWFLCWLCLRAHYKQLMIFCFCFFSVCLSVSVWQLRNVKCISMEHSQWICLLRIIRDFCISFWDLRPKLGNRSSDLVAKINF